MAFGTIMSYTLLIILPAQLIILCSMLSMTASVEQGASPAFTSLRASEESEDTGGNSSRREMAALVAWPAPVERSAGAGCEIRWSKNGGKTHFRAVTVWSHVSMNACTVRVARISWPLCTKH